MKTMTSVLNGYYRKIISFNKMQFVFGFEFENNGKKYLARISKAHNYLIELD